MVGHQAVANQGKFVQCAVLAQEIDVDEFVGIGFKNESPRVCALRHVMCNVDSNDSGQTSHGRKNISEKRENVPSVPRFPPLELEVQGKASYLATRFEARTQPMMLLSTFSNFMELIPTLRAIDCTKLNSGRASGVLTMP